MCLGIPFKIIQKTKNEAIGEANGIRQKIRIDFVKDIKIGEFVMVHAGFAIDKLDESQALSVNSTLAEISKIIDENEALNERS